jgi:hypothetical protein
MNCPHPLPKGDGTVRARNGAAAFSSLSLWERAGVRAKSAKPSHKLSRQQ